MASQQDPRAREDIREKEVRTEEAARAAADELHDINKQRGEVVVDQNRPGIIGSIFSTVTGTLGGAKDGVIGKTHEAHDKASIVSQETAERERRNKAAEYEDSAAQKAKEAKDATMAKTGEYKDYTAQKTKEAVDTAAQKAKEAKEKTKETADAAAQKAKEAKERTKETADAAAQKAKEAKDTTMAKAGEYKDYAAQKTKETADEAKDTTMEKMGEYKDYAAQKTKETADATAQKAKETKDYTVDKAKEAKDYTAEKAKDAKDATMEKTKEGKDGAVGKLTELKDKAMDFFTGKKEEAAGDFRKGTLDEAEEDARRKMETLHLKDQGYEARGTGIDTTRSGGRGDEVIMKKTTVTAVDPMSRTAEVFRQADQMTGQAFNDVGPMDQDVGGAQRGVHRVQLTRENK